MLRNLKKILTHRASFLVWLSTTLLVGILWYRYSDVEYVAGNYQSYTFAYFDIALSLLLILCFPIILSAIVYKSMLFGKKEIKRHSSFLGIIGGIMSTFITGCVCCGVSLLSVLGLTSIIGFLEILPYDGIEIKAIAIIVLLYSTYDVLKYLEVCKIKK